MGHGLIRWSKSPAGRTITAVAPGEDVRGARAETANIFSLSWAQGTTLAASLTAGIAALWVGHHGRAKLLAAARQAKTTVQNMFAEAVESTAHDAAHWSQQDRRKTGAGLIDAERILALDLATLASAAANRKDPNLKSSLALLQERAEGAKFLTDSLTPGDPARVAAELIWLQNMNGAIARIGADNAKALHATRRPTPSDEALALLEQNPRLAKSITDPPGD